MKFLEIAAVVTGNFMVGTSLFVVIHNAVHRGQDQWWDGKFVAGLLIGGILLAYYQRVGKALKAVKDYIPASIGKKAE